MNLRDAVAMWAESQVGKVSPEQYWRVVMPSAQPPFPPHWCGAFALWCLRVANLCDWEWSLKADEPGFLFRLPKTDYPEPGDLVYRAKHQHHAVVVKSSPKRVVCVGGNLDDGTIVDYQVFIRAECMAYSLNPLLDAIYGDRT
jgi:hypothetical protein